MEAIIEGAEDGTYQEAESLDEKIFAYLDNPTEEDIVFYYRFARSIFLEQKTFTVLGHEYLPPFKAEVVINPKDEKFNEGLCDLYAMGYIDIFKISFLGYVEYIYSTYYKLEDGTDSASIFVFDPCQSPDEHLQEIINYAYRNFFDVEIDVCHVTRGDEMLFFLYTESAGQSLRNLFEKKDALEEIKVTSFSQIEGGEIPELSEWLALRKKHPEAILLIKKDTNFYECYCQDAREAASILGITLTEVKNGKYCYNMAGFPYHALDTYLPKLIRAGKRVAICDDVTRPKGTVKRSIDSLCKK